MGSQHLSANLARLVDDARDGGHGRKVLAQHLASPWHWPPGKRVAKELTELSGHKKQAPGPGEVVLVGVEGGRRGWAWALAPGGESHFACLDEVARASLSRARGLALGALPVLNPTLADRAHWRCTPLGTLSAERPHELRGESFGAAFFLAAASLTVEQPVPVELAALAALGPGNRLAAVQGLEAKLRVVTEELPAVQRVAVAREQEAEARDIVARLSRRLEVRAVATLGALEALAFPRGWWRRVPDAQVDAQASALFSFAVTASPHVTWRSVWSGLARSAEALQRRTRPRSLAHARLVAALEIARRNLVDERRGGLPPLAAVADGASRIVRLRYLAHRLQSNVDGGFGDVRMSVAEVRRELPATPREATSDELVLFGAVGRALGRTRGYRDASALLEATCDAWRAAGRLEDASVPACEWVRVASLAGEPQALERALGLARLVAAAPRTSEVSAAFLHLAMGRALVQVGRANEGEESLRLATQAERMGMRDVVASAWRWLARAAQASGQAETARMFRREALARAAPDMRALVHFDAAEARGRLTPAVVARVAALKDFRHLLRGVPARARAAVIARESPY